MAILLPGRSASLNHICASEALNGILSGFTTTINKLEQLAKANMVSVEENTNHIISLHEQNLSLTAEVQAAKAFGKRLQHFMANQETKEYMQHLAAVLNDRDSGELTQSTRGVHRSSF